MAEPRGCSLDECVIRQSQIVNLMNLPNYFLADLPPEATLVAGDDDGGVPDAEAQPRALPGRRSTESW